METKFNKDRAIKIAEDAADIIDRGWYQYGYTDGKGNYCALGALRMAAEGSVNAVYDLPEEQIVENVAENILMQRGDGRFLAAFNDDPTTTQAEVSDLFRLTAKEIANNN